MTLEDLVEADEKLVKGYVTGQVTLTEFRERSDELALLAFCIIGRADEPT